MMSMHHMVSKFIFEKTGSVVMTKKMVVKLVTVPLDYVRIYHSNTTPNLTKGVGHMEDQIGPTAC